MSNHNGPGRVSKKSGSNESKVYILNFVFIVYNILDMFKLTLYTFSAAVSLFVDFAQHIRINIAARHIFLGPTFWTSCI